MIFYLTPIDTFSLFRSVFETFDFKVSGVRFWPLTFKGQLGSKIFSSFESSYTTSFQTSIDAFSPSRTVLEIFDFKIFGVWPWLLNFAGYLGLNIFPSYESTYITPYQTSFDTFSLSCTVFNIFGFKNFWGLTLTFDLQCLHEFSDIFPIHWLIHDFLSNSYRHFLSISIRIRDFRLLNFWSLNLIFDIWWLPEIKNVFSIRKLKHDFLSDFYRRFLSISYRFRDFRLRSFRGLTWTFDPLEVTWGQKCVHCLNAQTWLTIQLLLTLFLYLVPFLRYSTPYFFRFWPWPLNLRGHLGSIIFSLFESTHTTSYLTTFDNFFSSRTVFEFFDFKILEVLTLTFEHWRSPGVKWVFTIRKPIHDFLSNPFWHFLAISYRFRDFPLQNFWGLTSTIEL